MVDARETGVRSEPEVWMEHRTPDRVPPSLQPEHDWSAASPLIRPALRPVGISGVDGPELRIPTRGSGPGKTVVKAGPAGLPIVYVLPGAGFDVVVSVDHLLAWGVGPDQVHAAAMANLGSGSAELAWTDEVSGRRKIVWLDRGDGMDAARILLGEVRTHLRSALGTAGRVLVGLPERDLLIAAGLAEGDADFPALFAQYVADRAEAADEPIDDRVFELLDGELVEFLGGARPGLFDSGADRPPCSAEQRGRDLSGVDGPPSDRGSR